MPTIRANVQALQMIDRILQRSLLADHPAAELLDGREMEVRGLGSDSAPGPLPVAVVLIRSELLQVPRDPPRLDIRVELGAAAVEDSCGPRPHLCDVASAAPLGPKR